MRVGVRISIAAAMLGLLALAGCGRGFFQDAERAPWRREAEMTCLKSGVVKLGTGIVQVEPIEGPGVCGADFPLKVAALGEGSALTSFAEAPRPPAVIPNGSSAAMPRWPASQPRYAPPAPVETAAPIQRGNMRWIPGPPAINAPDTDEPLEQIPDGPMSISPPQANDDYRRPPVAVAPVRRAAPMGEAMEVPSARPMPDDIPDDAVLPGNGNAAAPAARQRGAYNAPVYEPPPREAPRLGPARAPASTASAPAATLTPAATLACPIVSALDRWVSEGVQPAALHWFGSPVVTIKQISAYSCRRMVGAGGHGISEHAFGNALDIAAFKLADGRTISVQHGWRGSPEEQGFLHDVQLFACQTFNTVLAPGYNAAHYNHIHVDLMQRANGRRPCRPNAIPGEVVAARARAQYASKQRGPLHTGSIGALVKAAQQEAIAGEDGYVDDDESDTPPAKPTTSMRPFSLPLRAAPKSTVRPESRQTVTY